MKTENVKVLVDEVIRAVGEAGSFRIDEKIAACRAAADFFAQIMTTESTVVMMKECALQSLRNLDKPEV